MPNTHHFSRRQFVARAGSVATAAALLTNRISGAQLPNTKAAAISSSLTPYLLFEGTCGDAMHFYQSVFGGELTVTHVKDSRAKNFMPAFQQEKVLNAHLQNGAVELSASDWLMPDRTPVRGNTVCLYLRGGTLAELKTLFEGLSQGAAVTDPLKEQFFGTYGALNDRFGVRWMFQTASQT